MDANLLSILEEIASHLEKISSLFLQLTKHVRLQEKVLCQAAVAPPLTEEEIQMLRVPAEENPDLYDAILSVKKVECQAAVVPPLTEEEIQTLRVPAEENLDFYGAILSVKKAFMEGEMPMLRPPWEEYPCLYDAMMSRQKEPEAVCMAMTEEAYQAMLKEKKEHQEAATTPVLLQAKKSRPDYNNRNWPSPTTKRFAKHVATYRLENPESIKTHQDALNFLASIAKISVDDLLKISMGQYQEKHVSWTVPEYGTHPFR